MGNSDLDKSAYRDQLLKFGASTPSPSLVFVGFKHGLGFRD